MAANTSQGISTVGLERKLNDVASSVHRIEDQLVNTNDKITSVADDLGKVSHELTELRTSFEEFMQETIRANMLQKALTELVRVRQEIENNFGGYKVVRETMLGVLQATDLALVKKTTISQVTEELMLSTPDYWLAPCLVAVSAWIGNNRDLANRAIAEAVKRDEEKTALTMALICRRNNRTATCFEWLSLYFSRQTASNFTKSNFTYLNAYLNGVFGPDENHMCDDYVAKWMREIQSNGGDVEKQQVEQWSEYCSSFTVDLDSQFPQMNSCVHEYSDIAAYVSRICSVDTIANNFSQMKNVEVDQQALKQNIDQTLIDLISHYDKREEPLRNEERYLIKIREFNGDAAAARAAILEEDRAKTENALDLISQMTNIVVEKEPGSPSEKKTSVSYLSSYIRSGFQNYITEKKTAFPKGITLNIDGWSGKSEDGSNADALQKNFEETMQQNRKNELDAIDADKPKKWRIAAIVCAVIALVGVFTTTALAVAGVMACLTCFFLSWKSVKDIADDTNHINQTYDQKIVNGKKQIADALSEWTHAKEVVRDFESHQLPDVVA